MSIDPSYYKVYAQKLLRSELFAHLSEKTLFEMMPSFVYHRWGKNSHPIYSDHTKHFVYILLSGRIKVSKIDVQTGREFTLFILSNGDLLDT